MRFKNYRNSYTNDNRIYSKDEMLDMTIREIKDRAEEFIAQHRVLGLPEESELAGSDNVVHVESYTRSDGTEVKAHWRSKPGTGSLNNENSLPSKENNENGTSTGGAAEVDKTKEMIISDKIQEFTYEKALHSVFPMSSDATVNGMQNLAAARKNPNATVLEDLSSLGNQHEISILKNMGAKESDKGVIYNENSDVSKKFSNAPELEKHITSIRDDVLNDRQLEDTSITFESKKSDILNNPDNLDRHAFVHYGKIVDQKVGDDGIYTCKIIDYSNFEDKQNSNILDIPNQWGYDMQEKGLYKNYYVVIKIRKKVNW